MPPFRSSPPSPLQKIVKTPLPLLTPSGSPLSSSPPSSSSPIELSSLAEAADNTLLVNKIDACFRSLPYNSHLRLALIHNINLLHLRPSWKNILGLLRDLRSIFSNEENYRFAKICLRWNERKAEFQSHFTEMALSMCTLESLEEALELLKGPLLRDKRWKPTLERLTRWREAQKVDTEALELFAANLGEIQKYLDSQRKEYCKEVVLEKHELGEEQDKKWEESLKEETFGDEEYENEDEPWSGNSSSEEEFYRAEGEFDDNEECTTIPLKW